MTAKKFIPPEQLVPMDMFEREFPLRVEVAYKQDNNLLFGERIYRPDARLWLHEGLARVVLLAARLVHDNENLRLVVYDGLRTVEAQTRMLKTQRVKDHPQWLEEPRLLSPPGAGGHPRAMAVDVALEDAHGTLLDMGTPFDFLAEDSSPQNNPAHRNYQQLDNQIAANRQILDHAMREAAARFDAPLLPLPEEWWDFRLPPDLSDQYAPLYDAQLPPQMRVTDTRGQGEIENLPEAHFDALKKTLIDAVDQQMS